MRRKLARRIGLWLFRLILVLLLVVGTALVAVFSLEQYSLRPLTEYLVEKATGRSFSIDGGLELQAGRVIDIRAGGIRLANADWGSGDNLL
ncbi:MAG: AsmA family protein, partial [Gammaproteobacteria bacterium]